MTEEGFGDSSSTEFTDNASESSEDYIEPDFKVEDGNKGIASENIDEETRKLIKPEQLLSEALLKMYSQTLSPIPSLTFFPSPGRDLTINTEQISSTISDVDIVLGSEWASHIQLIIFCVTAAKIADDYVKDRGVKIHHYSARRTVIHNRAAYNQGVKDSKKIDVHRRRIEE